MRWSGVRGCRRSAAVLVAVCDPGEMDALGRRGAASLWGGGARAWS